LLSIVLVVFGGGCVLVMVAGGIHMLISHAYNWDLIAQVGNRSSKTCTMHIELYSDMLVCFISYIYVHGHVYKRQLQSCRCMQHILCTNLFLTELNHVFLLLYICKNKKISCFYINSPKSIQHRKTRWRV